MFRCSLNVIESFCKPRYIVWKKSINILENFARGNSTLTAVSNKPVILYPLLSHLPQLNEIKCPEHSTIYSTFNISLPSMKNFAINKNLPFTSFDKNIRHENFPEETVDITQRNDVHWMGSLLKKRRRNMNRQKYKKRRKRDRFKREALKNLRKKKRQRKERVAERKQTILSNMVVNKSISKRRARYLSHKLLPGVVKGQGLG